MPEEELRQSQNHMQKEQQEISYEGLQEMFGTSQDIYEHRDIQGPAARSKHQVKSKLGMIRAVVLNEMPDALDHMLEIESGHASRQVTLHHSRGTKLLEEGNNVLEFDIAGSGFSEFQNKHLKLGGKGDAYEKIDGEKKQIKIEDLERPEDLKIRWHNRWLGWLPGIRSASKIRKINEMRKHYHETSPDLVQRFREKYGERVQEGPLAGKKHILVKSKKKAASDGSELEKRRITMAGPLSLGGARNGGDYSIEKLREYMLIMGQGYLQPLLEQWKTTLGDARALVHEGKFQEAQALRDSIHPVTILLKGHSRGGVAMSHGAMMIKYWLNENYPDLQNYVKFETIHYDPVPGFGDVFNVKKEVNLNETDEKKLTDLKKRKMMPLGDSEESTLVYSMYSDHDSFFTPQLVKGAKRLILTPYLHSVGLDAVDETQEEKHRAGFTDAKTGEVYRNSGLNRLDAGIYIMDEKRTLIRLEDPQTAQNILKEVMKDTSIAQNRRKKRIYAAVDAWFKEHSEQAAQ